MFNGFVSAANDPKFQAAFKIYSDEHIQPLLADLETKRLKALWRFKYYPVIGLVVFVLLEQLTIRLNLMSGWIENWIFLYLFVALFFCLYIMFSFQSSGKKLLLPKILDYWPELQKDKRSDAELSNFWLQTLTTHKPLLPDFKTVEVDDKFSGNLTGVPITFSEIRLSAEQNKESKVYSGLAVFLQLEKQFSGRTLVFNRMKNPILNKIENFSTRKNVISIFKAIHLEDPEFEKQFSTFGDNQTSARTVLTPAFIERLKTLKILFKATPLCSFLNNEVVILFPMYSDWFEPATLFKSVLSNDDVETAACQIYLITEIVKILKFDQLLVDNELER